ncbi:hypothetical protein NX059_006840 [Plenodomus lindquistii]|nr:hypothetical protein NX059_006840 [Plenodomus lindquistii]
MSAATALADTVAHPQLKLCTSSANSTTRCETGESAEEQSQHDCEVHDLAREISKQQLGSPFAVDPDSRLDPASDSFQAKEWARSFHRLRYSGSEAIPRVAGVAFRGLNVWGKGSPTEFQSTVSNFVLKLPALFNRGSQRFDILRDVDGLLLPGEQLCVLGPPGSGCSTLLKSIAGETHGLEVSRDSLMNYEGVPASEMKSAFRGEAIYTAEVDAHFPQLSVGDTLYFAALARTPRLIPGNITRERYAEHLRNVVMAMFGISHTVNTRVGNDFVRGTFDKVTVLYEGRQIYFGPSNEARAYFERLGFDCSASQTTPDFLTSMTSASERRIKAGSESSTPRTSDDFARCWKESDERQQLLASISAYDRKHPLKGPSYEQFAQSRSLEQSKRQRKMSPYNLSYWSQVKLCMWRDVQRLKNDPSVTLTMLFVNFVEALIIVSIFFNLSGTTESFFKRGGLLFMVVLLNAFSSILEIMNLYAKRTIVEKHKRYALYHPSAEAMSAMIVDLPYKVANSFIVNTTLYFMGNLRRQPGPFFFFLLVGFSVGMSMSMLFRLLASMTKTIAQALAPSCLILLMLVLYTGFAIPVQYMRGWIKWFRWINPVFYGFENVMTNEFHGRSFACSEFIPAGPGYENITADQRACAVQGSTPSSDTVSGTVYVWTAFQYKFSNRWTNYAAILAITVFLFIAHLVMSEIVASERSKGEVLVYRRSRMKRVRHHSTDEEHGNATAHLGEKLGSDTNQEAALEKQVSIFHWERVNYEVDIKGEARTILDSVDGWITPGTLTALMGVSGAGKTTLLDVLASRTTMGVISGSMLVDGRERDESFQRNTGYAMQQDIHLDTSTVREALEFSALLRQPPSFSRQEKIAYVDHVLQLLDMEDYADAIVGMPERKRLTIGVELAARPKLLLFLDEPTSGLDSQTSWSICDLMEKLTRNGQAILCTIHQPSSLLFQRFDRILLLQKGGRTVYFGDIGRNAKTLLDYFARNGAPKCPPGTNPAEYMLSAIGSAPGTRTEIDWPAVWKSSPEYSDVQAELRRLRGIANQSSVVMDRSDATHEIFATTFRAQLMAVALRCGQQYWRTPSYIYSKMLLTVGSALMIGCSFIGSDNTSQGLQNQMFGVFIFVFVAIQLIYQIMPMWISQRTLFESRERQSKTYAWQAFVISNIVIEMAWNALMAIMCFVAWYYPAGLYRNAEATDTTHIRSFLTLLVILATFLFTSTFAHMLIAGAPNEEIAGAVAALVSIMLYAFCGILSGPSDLPGFWIFMYRVNPFTYLVSSFMSSTLGQAPVFCAENEFQTFLSPPDRTCGEFMASYISQAGGYLRDAQATQCDYCQMDNTDQFLQRIHVRWDNRWRDFSLLWVYVAFNIVAAVFLYWLCRVPRVKKTGKSLSP